MNPVEERIQKLNYKCSCGCMKCREEKRLLAMVCVELKKQRDYWAEKMVDNLDYFKSKDDTVLLAIKEEYK